MNEDLKGEVITHTERFRTRFLATSTGFNNGDGVWVIGPVIVDVVIVDAVSNIRPRLHPTYSVEIDGRYQYGGHADHLLDADGAVSEYKLAPMLLVRSGTGYERCAYCYGPITSEPQVCVRNQRPCSVAVENVIRTEDGINVSKGDRVYNYYDGYYCEITECPDSLGWFGTMSDSGLYKVLNGERICSVAYAERNYP